MTTPRKSRDPKTLRPATRLIHGGSLRSRFEETSEALFLTQSYLYDTMEIAEARFKGDDPGFVYSRFSNPTVAMFEQRMALLEGAEAARATASGMAAVTAALMGQLKAGDHVVAAQGPVRLLPLCRRGTAAAFRRRLDPGRRGGPRRLARGHPAQHQNRVPRDPDQPDAGDRRHRRRRRDHRMAMARRWSSTMCSRRRSASSRWSSAPIASSIRRPSTSTARAAARRRHPGEREIHRRPCPQFPAPDRAGLSPFNAWVLLKGLETLALRVAAQTRSAERIARLPRRPSGGRARALSGPRRPSAARARPAADERRRHAARLRGRRRQGGRVPLRQRAVDHRHLEQSGRRQEPRSPIPTTTTHQRLKPERRAALGIGPTAAPAVGRPRGRGRSDRRPGSGARQSRFAAPPRGRMTARTRHIFQIGDNALIRPAAAGHLVTAISAIWMKLREECPAPDGHPGRGGRLSDRPATAAFWGRGEAGSRTASSLDPDRCLNI